MIFSIKSRTVLCRQLASMLLAFSLLAAGAGSSWAGYSPAGSISDQGGGSWGSILRLSVQLQGDMARFTVSKKDGLPFSAESSIFIRKDSHGGKNVASSWIQCGVRDVVLNASLDDAASFYAYVSNSYGYAWVGPVQAEATTVDDSRWPSGAPKISELPAAAAVKSHAWVGPVQAEATMVDGSRWPSGPALEGAGECLGAPKISELPATAAVKAQVDVRVTAGFCRDSRGSVKVQCFADGSNHERFNPYLSRSLWPGETIVVPFVFRTEGTTSIACVTKDSCCSSQPTRQTIRIHPYNRPPAAPRISSMPAEARTGVPVAIQVVAGSDPDGDMVKVQCRDQENRNYRDVAPLGPPRPVDALFHFGSPGSKRIACRTVDARKGASEAVGRSIVIHENRSRKQSRGLSETKINISVLAGPDGTDSRVSIESSGGDCAPFCDENGEITYGKPYVPDDKVYSEQHEVRRIVSPMQYEEDNFADDGDDGPWQQRDNSHVQSNIQSSMP